MTTYITWLKTGNDTFRASYLAAVGEDLGESPASDATHYIAGSSRITPAQITALQSDYPQAGFSATMPAGAWE